MATTTRGPVKTMVVDDSSAMRQTIRSSLASIKRVPLQVIAEASDGLQAVQTVTARRPDLVTMDLHMPRMDGFEAIRKVVSKLPDVKVLVISAVNDGDTAMRAIENGAHGFLPKPFTHAELEQKVLAVLADD